MGQYLQLELRTVRATLGAQPVDTVQTVVAHPGPDLLFGHRPLPRQQLRSAFACQKALDDLKIELCLVLLHKTL